MTSTSTTSTTPKFLFFSYALSRQLFLLSSLSNRRRTPSGFQPRLLRYINEHRWTYVFRPSAIRPYPTVSYHLFVPVPPHPDPRRRPLLFFRSGDHNSSVPLHSRTQCNSGDAPGIVSQSVRLSPYSPVVSDPPLTLSLRSQNPLPTQRY